MTDRLFRALPDSDITLWELTAINGYLVDKYDAERALTYESEPEKDHLKQWLHFQSSGRGPYFGREFLFLEGGLAL
jgi:glutathione S-transferase